MSELGTSIGAWALLWTTVAGFTANDLHSDGQDIPWWMLPWSVFIS